jgi:hypothetical protein
VKRLETDQCPVQVIGEYEGEDFRLSFEFVVERFAQWFEWVSFPFFVVMQAKYSSAGTNRLRKPVTNVFEWLWIFACDNH